MEVLNIYLIVIAFLILLSVLASKLSNTFGVPALFIFLGLGMLAGSDGLLGIQFDNVEIARNVGTVALIFILFGGGLDTTFRAIRPVLKEGILLATIGVVLTALVVAAGIYFLFDFSFLESLLIGAIISSTDAAAVFAILRAKGIHLKKRLAPLLELESGSNDPMAIFLTIAILQMLILPQLPSVGEWILEFFLQFLIGVVLGYIFGITLPPILNRAHLSFYGLYPVLTIGWVLLLYSSTSMLDGNGFLAVYIAGITANTKEFVHKKNLVGFHDGVSWMMQITVFLVLGLLVFPSDLPNVALSSLAIAFWLMFVARPLGVFLSLHFSPFAFREKLFISWVGLRGSVPIILATYPFIENFEHSNLIFNMVFFIVLASILIQGTSLPFVAKWLKVEVKKDKRNKKLTFSPLLAKTLKQFYIQKSSPVINKSIVELDLPLDFLILLINRDGKYFKPTGSTMLKENDMLLIQCSTNKQYKVGLEHFV